MKRKKLMSLLLASTMVLSLAACGSTDKPAAEPAAKEEAAAPETEAEAPAEEAAEEVPAAEEGEKIYSEEEQVEVTFWSPSADSSIDGVLDSAVADVIAQKTGVRIKSVQGNDEKFQVLLAAGDLPDVVYANGTGAGSSSNLISSGQLLELDDLVAEHGDNIQKWGAQALTYSQNVLSDESGTLYFIPMNVSDNGDAMPAPSYYGCGITFNMRWDLYEKAGYPEITDEDSYLEVLKQMQEQFPKTDDGKTIYAMGGWSDWGTWAFRIPYTFANGTGEGKNGTVYSNMTGEIEMMYHSDKFWDAVRFYNKAYNMGILDPEAFTQTYDDYVAKAKAGQYIALGINGTGAMEGVNDALQAVDPSWGYQYVPCGMSYLSGLYTEAAPYGWGSGNFSWALTINNKYPEETMRLLNYLYSPECSRMLMCGIEGEDWEYAADGKLTYTEDYKAGVAADLENFRKNRGIGVYTYLNGLGAGQLIEDGTPVNIEYAAENIGGDLSVCDQNYCDYYSELYGKEIQYPGQAVEMLLETGNYEFTFEQTGLVNSLTVAIADEAASILTEIGNTVNTDFVTLIMLPEAELEDALQAEIEKIDAAGYADLKDEINRLTEEAKVRAAEIAK